MLCAKESFLFISFDFLIEYILHQHVECEYFYSVDVSEFAVNKLGDRGSLSAKSIVTNVQDFVVNVSKGLGL